MGRRYGKEDFDFRGNRRPITDSCNRPHALPAEKQTQVVCSPINQGQHEKHEQVQVTRKKPVLAAFVPDMYPNRVNVNEVEPTPVTIITMTPP